MTLQGTETYARFVGLPLPDVRPAFRQSTDCNTKYGDFALSIADIVAPIQRC